MADIGNGLNAPEEDEGVESLGDLRQEDADERKVRGIGRDSSHVLGLDQAVDGIDVDTEPIVGFRVVDVFGQFRVVRVDDSNAPTSGAPFPARLWPSASVAPDQALAAWSTAGLPERRCRSRRE